MTLLDKFLLKLRSSKSVKVTHVEHGSTAKIHRALVDRILHVAKVSMGASVAIGSVFIPAHAADPGYEATVIEQASRYTDLRRYIHDPVGEPVFYTKAGIGSHVATISAVSSLEMLEIAPKGMMPEIMSSACVMNTQVDPLVAEASDHVFVSSWRDYMILSMYGAHHDRADFSQLLSHYDGYASAENYTTPAFNFGVSSVTEGVAKKMDSHTRIKAAMDAASAASFNWLQNVGVKRTVAAALTDFVQNVGASLIEKNPDSHLSPDADTGASRRKLT